MRTSRIIFVFISVLIISSLTTALVLYFIETRPPNNNTNVLVQVVIDYGTLKKENYEEYNLTVENGSSAFQIFSSVANLSFTNYSFGVYITGVNGFSEVYPNYWSFYYYNLASKSWIYSEVGVDKYFLETNGSIKLQYTG